MYLVNKSFVIRCVADARSALGPSESAWGSPSESADESTWCSFELMSLLGVETSLIFLGMILARTILVYKFI